MLTLIAGFDQKSSTAISTCMVTGGAAATIFYNLRQRRPTIELPRIDHDLALLFQPMLVVRISNTFLSCNLPHSQLDNFLMYDITVGTTTKSFFKAVEMWKKETITKKNLLDASKRLQPNGDGNEDVEDRNIPGGPSNGTTESKEAKKAKVSLLDSVCWKPFGVVAAVWVTIVALQIAVVEDSLWSTVSGDWDPSSGFNCHKHLYHYILFIHVCCRILPPKTISNSYALYFAAASSLSAVRGKIFGGKVIKALGRTYLIIFILAFTTLGSTVSLALSSAAVSAHEEMLGSQPSSQNITGKEVQSHLGYNKHVWPASPIFYYLSWV
ncbi:hypothetical protein L3X38_016312 [Prunus dulcis]|uniref:Uncharacterized protein n=1 Tax=Prunus dulcis TaxID=3755 RepID=A0AAD4Z9P5_PRUDU|nr:hypothetical protein L3X38_016312 [Prunus dulcis]